MKPIHVKKSKFAKKRGAAVSEFAICIPVLLVLVLGGIECTSMIFVHQSLNVVAYEGIRAAIKSNGTSADALARCDEVIQERRIRNATVTIAPTTVEDVERGLPVRVTVSAPCVNNAVFALQFFSGSMQASAVMIKE